MPKKRKHKNPKNSKNTDLYLENLRNPTKYFSKTLFDGYIHIIFFFSDVLKKPKLQIINYMPKFKKYFFIKCQRIANAVVKSFFAKKFFKVSYEEKQDIYEEIVLLLYTSIEKYDLRIGSSYFSYASSIAFNYILNYVNKRLKYSYESEIDLSEINHKYDNKLNYFETVVTLQDTMNNSSYSFNRQNYKKFYRFIYDFISYYSSCLSYFFVTLTDVNISWKIYEILLQNYVKEIDFIVNNTNYFNKFYYQKKNRVLQDSILEGLL